MRVMEALRAGTRDCHDLLEQRLDLLGPQRSLEDYRGMLRAFWGLYAPLEAQLAAAGSGRVPLDLAPRWKVELLCRDLAALGDDEAARSLLPVWDGSLKLVGVPQVLGCLYVVEGSTLGGQLLARHFGQLLGVDRTRGLAFFSGYASRTGEMWREFGGAVEQAVVGEEATAVCVRSARETFEVFDQWLTERLTAPA